MSQDTITHEDGLNTHEDGLKLETIREFFYMKDGVLHWKKEPHKQGGRLVDTPSGWQAKSTVNGRTYMGNIFVRFMGKQYPAQFFAWALYHGEVLTDNVRIIHLDGDRSNNAENNLHLQIRYQSPDSGEYKSKN